MDPAIGRRQAWRRSGRRGRASSFTPGEGEGTAGQLDSELFGRGRRADMCEQLLHLPTELGKQAIPLAQSNTCTLKGACTQAPSYEFRKATSHAHTHWGKLGSRWPHSHGRHGTGQQGGRGGHQLRPGHQEPWLQSLPHTAQPAEFRK